MEVKLDKIKQESENIKSEVSEKIAGYITAGFGLVVGLAWNDAIRSLIEFWFPIDKNTIWAKLIYAFILTIILVIVTMYLVRLFKKSEKGQ